MDLGSGHDWVTDPQVRAQLRRKAEKLRSCPALRNLDDEDLQQELIVGLLTRGHGYNPQRGHPMAFVRVALDSTAASMIRHELALKRSPTMMVALNNLDEAVQPSSRGDHEPTIDLSLDLQTVIEQLPEDLQEGCARALRDADSKCLRSRFTDRAMRRRLARHRTLFEQHGFGP